MTTIGTVAVAALLTLGGPAPSSVEGPAVSTAQGAAVVLEGQRTVRSSWQLDRAPIARDEWTSRRERLDRMRQRQQARAKIRALAGARALDRARTRAERAWARWYDGVFNRARARALRAARAMRARSNRLRALDLDNNGVISRNEWRRRSEVFDRLDRNRDGVLSTDELKRQPRSRPLR